MKILVTNDDGVQKEGLRVLVKALKELGHDVSTVAPAQEQSAVSSSLTLRKGISCEKINDVVPKVETYQVEGTPVDCVKAAIHILNIDFDLLISGVNNGYNLGEDIIYSGTVAAAKEAVIYDKKSIAISCEVGSLEGFNKIFKKLFCDIIKSDIYKESQMLNINIPSNPKDVKITHQGWCKYNTNYDLKDGKYFAIGKPNFSNDRNDVNSDIYQIMYNNVSVTPVTIDVTDYTVFKKYSL